MITGISIENFKVFRKRIDLELAPITLLFGRNSAGKSTVLQALGYAREMVVHGNATATHDECGGFRNVLPGQGGPTEIAIGLRTRPTNAQLLQHFASFGGSVDEGLASRIRDIGLEVCGKWDLEERPHVGRWALTADGGYVVRIETQPNREPILWTDFATQWLSHAVRENLVPSLRPAADRPDFGVWKHLHPKLSNDVRAYYCMPGRKSALPVAGLGLDMAGVDNDPLAAEAATEVDHLVLGSRSLFSQYLTGIRHVGPIRVVPPRGLVDHGWPTSAGWYDGSAAWALLQRQPKFATHHVGPALTMAQTGHGLRALEVALTRDPVGLATAIGLEIRDGLNEDWLAGVADNLAATERHVLLEITSLGGTRTAHPKDVGVGVSQLIPVIAAALSRADPLADGGELPIGLVAIEQPELHVHPAVQSEIADLFVETIHDLDTGELSGRQYLIETHSEHLVLRLLRRIRETTENPDVPIDRRLRPEDIAIYYFDNVDGEVKVTRIGVDEDGEFTDKWPHGFFPERLKEL